MGDLNSAFRKMRRAGLIAKQHYSCCQSCAGAGIAHEIREKRKTDVKGCVFYTRQDAEGLKDAQKRYQHNLARKKPTGALPGLFLAYGPVDVSGMGEVGLKTAEVGKIVVGILREEGIPFQWDGDENTRIWVTPLLDA